MITGHRLLRPLACQQLAVVLARDFPAFNFVESDQACWSALRQTIYYSDSPIDLIHELGHALLSHSEYGQDIELLQMERDAWNKAREIAPEYGFNISDEEIESAIESYREWLYARSLCPKCQQTGIQSKSDLLYQCPNCHTTWRSNDARNKRLWRHVITK